MSIQPLTSHPREISVTEPIEPAFDRVKLMLFRPFNLTRWIMIGFCAWLAGLGESGGGGGGFNGFNGFNDNHANHSGKVNFNQEPVREQFRHFYHDASDYIIANLVWIIPVAAVLFLVALGIGLLVLWLNSRGKFMFLHCVALNRAEVEAPWSAWAGEANSLFKFKVVLSLIGLVLTLPLVIFLAINIIQMVASQELDAAKLIISIVLFVALLLLAIVFAIIQKLTADFVVPIMFLRREKCLGAWREFLGLLKSRPGTFVIYILFQIVLNLVITAMVVMAMLITCCTAACFLAIPFLGTVLMLPVIIFQRAYSLHYLAQFGAQYNVFPQPPEPPVQPAAPPSSPDAPIPTISPLTP